MSLIDVSHVAANRLIQFFIGLIYLAFAGATVPASAAENKTGTSGEYQKCSKFLDPKARLSCFDQIDGLKSDKEPIPKNTRRDRESFLKSAKETLRTLKKMEAKTSAGISYRDYSQALADVIYETSEFVEGDYGKFNEEFTAEILEAKNDYERAGAIWDIKFKGDITCYKPPCNFSFFATHDKWLEWYPELKAAYIKVGDFQPGYSVDQSVSIVFLAASKRIAKAAEILKPKIIADEDKSLGHQTMSAAEEIKPKNENQVSDLENPGQGASIAGETDKKFQENAQVLLDGKQSVSNKMIENSFDTIPSSKAALECASWLATYAFADANIATRIERNEWGDLGYFSKRSAARRASGHPLMMVVEALVTKGGGERELQTVMEQVVAPKVAKLLLQVSGEHPKKKKGEQSFIALPRIQEKAEAVCANAGEADITIPTISNLSAVTF